MRRLPPLSRCMQQQQNNPLRSRTSRRWIAACQIAFQPFNSRACTLYGARRCVIESRRMRPTNRHSQSDSHSAHIYEIRPRMDQRSVDLISAALPFGRFWFTGSNAASRAIECAKIRSQSHDFVIRLYDTVGNVIETYERKGDLKEW